MQGRQIDLLLYGILILLAAAFLLHTRSFSDETTKEQSPLFSRKGESEGYDFMGHQLKVGLASVALLLLMMAVVRLGWL